MRLQPVPVLADNYVWLLDAGSGPLVVDPGEAGPVLRALDGTAPSAILLTHHHGDHVGGAAGLLERWPALPVLAPADDRIAGATAAAIDGSVHRLGGLEVSALAVPGHTRSHVAYHIDLGRGARWLFSGDTLFSLGCGRLFEGTAAQMQASLDRLAGLPDDTHVCCGHEYTLANAAFARAVDPDNPALLRRIEEAQRMRHDGRSTLPARLSDERAANPFLRTDAPVVRAAVGHRLGRPAADRVEVFAELRGWKDGFRA